MLEQIQGCWRGPHTLPPLQQGTAPPVQGFTDKKTTLNCFSPDSHGPAQLGTTPAFSPGCRSRNGPDLSLCMWGDSSDGLGGSQLGQNPQPAPSPL